jgi:phosphatidylserine decarboxylase
MVDLPCGVLLSPAPAAARAGVKTATGRRSFVDARRERAMDIAAGIAVGAGAAVAIALALAWKWQLGFVRPALAVALLSAGVGVAVGLVAASVGLSGVIAAALVCGPTLLLAGGLGAYRFYRDPERRPPDRDDVFVSPADGTVIYVHESRSGQLPVATKNGRRYRLDELTRANFLSGDAVVIGISLNFLDVHVNRSPIAGTIAFQEKFPGGFGSLRDAASIFENERATLVIERSDIQVTVVLIASRLVRRIVTFFNTGDEVALGQRIGAIRFGSQVDLIIPARPDLEVVVRPGDHVVAGESALAFLGAAHVEGTTTKARTLSAVPLGTTAQLVNQGLDGEATSPVRPPRTGAP